MVLLILVLGEVHVRHGGQRGATPARGCRGEARPSAWSPRVASPASSATATPPRSRGAAEQATVDLCAVVCVRYRPQWYSSLTVDAGRLADELPTPSWASVAALIHPASRPVAWQLRRAFRPEGRSDRPGASGCGRAQATCVLWGAAGSQGLEPGPRCLFAHLSLCGHACRPERGSPPALSSHGFRQRQRRL
jgi:hypothetical protein